MRVAQWLRNALAPCLHKWEPWMLRTMRRNVDGKTIGGEVMHRCVKCGLTKIDRL